MFRHPESVRHLFGQAPGLQLPAFDDMVSFGIGLLKVVVLATLPTAAHRTGAGHGSKLSHAVGNRGTRHPSAGLLHSISTTPGSRSYWLDGRTVHMCIKGNVPVRPSAGLLSPASPPSMKEMIRCRFYKHTPSRTPLLQATPFA